MISHYIKLLYLNCRSLRRSQSFNAPTLEAFLEKQINLAAASLQLKNEETLLQHLITARYDTIEDCLKQNPLVAVFYFVTSCSEIADRQHVDELGRYRFHGSVTERIGIEKNHVLDLIFTSLKTYPELSTHFEIASKPSLFFLSHDIDSLYGSFLQDGLWAAKHLRADVILKLLADTVTQKPAWFNIDRIMAIESEYDFRSTFYWLTEKGKINARETNSDYDIKSPLLVATLKKVEEKNFENGLHKSIGATNFSEELRKLPATVKGNRYHYLKYNLPNGYEKIEAAGLTSDASLGFAEHYGFRNNYGYPFVPFDFTRREPFSFLEIPLNVMDGTFQRYLKVPVEKTAETIIHFLEKNRQDCLLSILWHNTFFSNYKYKGYLAEYRKILAYLYEQKFENLNLEQITRSFSWKEN